MVSQKLLKIYRWLMFLVFDLIVLGAAVRVFNAGLACPDWPLCFGDIIPDYHPQVYFEFIHRALAGSIAVLFVGLAWTLWRSPVVRSRVKLLMVVAMVLLVAQIILGGLTVLKLLHAGIVTSHLILGLGFLGALYWGYDDLRQDYIPLSALPVPRWVVAMSLVVFIAVVMQVILGGLVASNYAGNVCRGFPLCNGQWVPTWSGPLGLQVIHRFGAYIVFTLIISANLYLQRHRSTLPPELTQTLRTMAYLVTAQLVVGISSVLLSIPALLTVLHSGLAALLVLSSLRLIRRATARAGSSIRLAPLIWRGHDAPQV